MNHPMSTPRSEMDGMAKALGELKLLVVAYDDSRNAEVALSNYRALSGASFDFIAMNIDTLAALVADGGWMPIEDAPKDGTKILLGWFLEAGGGGGPEVAFWHSIHQKWCGRELLNATGYFSPTHYRPLPPPPNPARAGGW